MRNPISTVRRTLGVLVLAAVLVVAGLGAVPAYAGGCSFPPCGEVTNNSPTWIMVSDNWCWGDSAPRYGSSLPTVGSCNPNEAYLNAGKNTDNDLPANYDDTDAFRVDAGCITKFDIGGVLPDNWPGSNSVDRVEDRRGKAQHKWIKLWDSDHIRITYQQCGGTPSKYYVNTWAKGYGYQDQYCYGDGGSGSDARCNSDGELFVGTNYFFCKVWGDAVGTTFEFNHWWLLTDLDSVYSGRDGRSFVSAYYLTGAGNQNNDTANYWNGQAWVAIPNCL